MKLNKTEQTVARSWLYDLFCGAGVIPETNSKRMSGRHFYDCYQNGYSGRSECTTIVNEILNREFKDIDTAIVRLSSYRFGTSFSTNRPRMTVTRSPEAIAAYIAWFCADQGIYWDDVGTNKTTYELEAFQKTFLGGALAEYNCFTSSTSTPSKNKKTTTNTTTSGTTTSQPKNGYKSSGGQSSNARDIKSAPGVKEYFTGSYMFKIEGTNANTKKIPYVFIRPLKSSGAAGSTNKIFVGDPSGYTDCTVFFTSATDADNCLAWCMQNNKVPTNISNLKVTKIWNDSNGYFKIGSEWGDVYIKASKLNENLEEDVDNNYKEMQQFKKDLYAEF